MYRLYIQTVYVDSIYSNDEICGKLECSKDINVCSRYSHYNKMVTKYSHMMLILTHNVSQPISFLMKYEDTSILHMLPATKRSNMELPPATWSHPCHHLYSQYHCNYTAFVCMSIYSYFLKKNVLNWRIHTNKVTYKN